MTQKQDFAALVNGYQAGIWRYLRALGCEREMAEDLTQETFLSVYRRPFDQRNPVSTAAYLRKVAHNLFISAKRKVSVRPTTWSLSEIDQDWSSLAGHDGGDELKQALKECFKVLDQRAQKALKLQVAARAKRNEIAKILEIADEGVKSLLSRSKSKLRACIERKMQ